METNEQKDTELEVLSATRQRTRARTIIKE